MDLSHFHNEGYQIVRGLIDQDALSKIHNFLDRSVGNALSLLRDAGLPVDDPGFAEQLSNLDDAELTEQAHSVLVGHFPLEVRLSEILWQAPFLESVKAVIREALRNDTIYMHLPPTARYVLPGNSRAGVPPHQDVSYNSHMSDFLVMWMPLVPITEDCGGVVVYQGSNEEVERRRANDGGDWLGGIETDGFTKVNCAPMEPGDVLLLNRWIVHGSAPNLSNATRFSVDYRFFGAPAQSDKHYLDLQTLDVVAPKAA